MSLVPLISNPNGTTTDKFDGGSLHSRVVSEVKPRLPHGDKLEDEDMGTQVNIPNSNVLNEHISLHTSSSGSHHSASVVRSSIRCHNLADLKQQIPSGLGLQEPTHDYVPTSSNNMKTPQLESHGSKCKASRSLKESVIVPLLGSSESCRMRNETSISNQCLA